MKKGQFLGRRAFTLAELMAVIVIIGIIAGIGFGSYRKSIERAKFAEGKSLAHAVAAARDAYYYEHIDLNPNVGSIDFSKIALDLKDKNGGAPSGDTFYGKNFNVVISGNVVRADRINEGYSICVYQEAFGGATRAAEKCVGSSTAAQEFCVSMGYSAASSC